MIATSILLMVSAVGVDTGWQPHEAGGLEYIIQIEPELLAALREGESLTSEIPAHVEGVRRYRIVVGNKPLPKISPPPASQNAPPPAQQQQSPPPPRATEREQPPRSEATEPPRVPPTEQAAEAAAPRYPTEPRYPSEPQGTDALPSREPNDAATEQAAQPQQPEAQPEPRYPDFDPPPPHRPELEPAVEPSRPAISEPIAETEPPRIFDGDGEPEGLQTTFKQPTEAASGSSAASSAETSDAPTLVGWSIALLLLVASLAANIYLGWMWIDTRRRYQSLVYDRGGIA